MSTSAQNSGPRLLPVMQYRDIGRAIEWLGKAFGFEEHHTVRGTDGKVLYEKEGKIDIHEVRRIIQASIPDDRSYPAIQAYFQAAVEKMKAKKK